MRSKASAIKATSEIYPDLQGVYDHFNRQLFAEILPPCLITLNRTKKSLGYFSPKRFVRYDGQITHEIAMNPAYFAARTLKDTLSTLAHEQVHLWQETHGTPSRRGYHNGEWAAMMEAIGLMPSDTGMPGGKRLGEHMDHYVMPGKLFDRSADELIAGGFRLSWLDRFPEAIPLGADIPGNYKPPIDGAPEEKGWAETDATAAAEAALATPRIPATMGIEAAASVIVWPTDQRAKGSKVKYRCHGCGSQVWGKSRLDMSCNPCGLVFDELPA